jgi:hypothetical protein
MSSGDTDAGNRNSFTAASRRTPWLLPLTIAVLIVMSAGVVTSIVRTISDGKPTSVDTSSWIRVVDRATRFTDRLPAQPEDQSAPPLDLAGQRVVLNIAAVHLSSGTDNGPAAHPVIVIEDGELSPALPSSEFSANLREAIFSIAGSSGFQLKANAPSTFDGRPAWTGTFRSSDQTLLQAVAFMQSGSRMYIILAKDLYFNAVATSFQAM